MSEQDPAVDTSNPDESTEDAQNEGSDGPQNLDLVLNIPVNLSIEVGSTQISIRKLLQLGKGSVVSLSRLAGEPLDVLVNGTLIARGEVVVVDDNYGIRLVDVISPEQRIASIN